MKKYIPKKSTITNLFVVPLIATAIFLARPALAADSTTDTSNNDIRHKTHLSNIKNEISGIVTSVNGNIVIVKSKDDIQYTVDAVKATIMKDSNDIEANPYIVMTSNIEIGDAIVVRGEILEDSEII